MLEEDVYLTMGFPRGSKPVSEARKNNKGDYLQVLDEWKMFNGEVYCLRQIKFLHK